jgi:hypothetical protein
MQSFTAFLPCLLSLTKLGLVEAMAKKASLIISAATLGITVEGTRPAIVAMLSTAN